MEIVLFILGMLLLLGALYYVVGVIVIGIHYREDNRRAEHSLKFWRDAESFWRGVGSSRDELYSRCMAEHEEDFLRTSFLRPRKRTSIEPMRRCDEIRYGDVAQ